MDVSQTLSAVELTAACHHRSAELPSGGGLKLYAPTDSWLEAKELQAARQDYYDCLAEHRVARLNHLMRGEWIPDLQAVEVVKTIGNKAQHLGFSVGTSMYLYPEEALFLLDSGLLEIWYGSTPLSLQQAYSMFLGGTVTLDMYMVFAHLLRLGFIARRFTPGEEFTKYEQEINLDEHSKISGKRSKRPKTSGPSGKAQKKKKRAQTSGSEDKEANMDVDTTDEAEKKQETEQKPLKYRFPMYEDEREWMALSALSIKDGASAKTKKPEDVCGPRSRTPGVFSNICLPNYADPQTITATKYPDTCCPPGTGPSSDSTDDLYERFKDCFTKQPEGPSTAQKRYSGRGYLSRVKIDAGSWCEYKAKKREIEEESRRLVHQSPLSVLWEGETKPLVGPDVAASIGNILQALRLTPPDEETAEKELPQSTTRQPHYSVYRGNPGFRRSQPGTPLFRLVVTTTLDEVPSMEEMSDLQSSSKDEVPIVFAVVCFGDITFYNLGFIDLSKRPGLGRR